MYQEDRHVMIREFTNKNTHVFKKKKSKPVLKSVLVTDSKNDLNFYNQKYHFWVPKSAKNTILGTPKMPLLVK